MFLNDFLAVSLSLVHSVIIPEVWRSLMVTVICKILLIVPPCWMDTAGGSVNRVV